jgi:hypothetical protein
MISSTTDKDYLTKDGFKVQLAGFCRFMLGILFILVDSIDDCPINNPIRTYVYLLTGQILMEFLPIYTILSIFTIPPI